LLPSMDQALSLFLFKHFALWAGCFYVWQLPKSVTPSLPEFARHCQAAQAEATSQKTGLR